MSVSSLLLLFSGGINGLLCVTYIRACPGDGQGRLHPSSLGHSPQDGLSSGHLSTKLLLCIYTINLCGMSFDTPNKSWDSLESSWVKQQMAQFL